MYEWQLLRVLLTVLRYMYLWNDVIVLYGKCHVSETFGRRHCFLHKGWSIDPCKVKSLVSNEDEMRILLYCWHVCVSLLSLFTVLLQTDYRYHVCYWAFVTTVITSLYQVARCGQWGWWPWPGVLLVTGWSRTWSLLPTASLSYLLSISVPAISQQFVSSDDNTTQNIFKNINGSVNSYLVKCAVKLVR